MDLGKEFGVDEALADGGIWLPIGENGSRLLLAAMPNGNLERHMEPIYRRYRQLGKGIPDVPENVHEEALSKCVLLGWEGIEENGQPLEPSEANRLNMIRKYPRFKSLIIREASNLRNFQRDEEKNS